MAVTRLHHVTFGLIMPKVGNEPLHILTRRAGSEMPFGAARAGALLWCGSGTRLSSSTTMQMLEGGHGNHQGSDVDFEELMDRIIQACARENMKTNSTGT